MKKFKLSRVLSLLMAVVMMLSIGVTSAFAASATDEKWGNTSTTGSLTIHAYEGRSYEVYQIFYGDYGTTTNQSTGKVESSLSNLEWGASMNETNVKALLAKLIGLHKTDPDATTLSNGLEIPSALKTAFSSTTYTDSKTTLTADEVATALKTLSSDSEAMDAFATILSDVISANKNNTECKTQSKSGTSSQNRVDYTINNLHDGYYLVLDASTLSGTATRSKAMIEVTGPTTLTTKEVSGPVIDKNTNDLKDAAVEIGKSVPFTLTSTVPDMSGYNKYYFIVTDKMGKGLTFGEDQAKAVTVQIDPTATTPKTLTNKTASTTYDGSDWFTVEYHVVTADDLTVGSGESATRTYKYASLTYSDIGKTVITIVFNNMKQYQDYAGKTIQIDYTATVNKDFESGNVSVVDNKAFVTYPNDPSHQYEGDNEPDDNDKGSVTTGSETGETNTTRLYTTQIVVNKTDSLGKRLTGAEFTISGNGSAATHVITEKYTRVFDYANKAAPAGGWYYLTGAGMYEQMTDPATSGAQSIVYVYQLGGTNVTEPGDTGWTMTQVAENTVADNLYYIKSTADMANLDASDVVSVADWNANKSSEQTTYASRKSGYAAYTHDGDESNVVSATGTSAQTATGSNGQIIFSNVGVTTYTITEKKAPNGYEELKNPITVKVTFTAPTTGSTKATWTYEVTNADGKTAAITSAGTKTGDSDAQKLLSVGTDGELILQVVNDSGATLPTTGGIGTTIFYVLGSILVVGAVILLVVKRRMQVDVENS